jgi:putative oxidoreductase
MTMATATVHWGKPIWVSAGGAELPMVYMASALSVARSGPGRYSLDRLLRRWLPWSLVMLATSATATGIALGLTQPTLPLPTPASQEQPSAQEKTATA